MFADYYSFCKILGSFRLAKWFEQATRMADTGSTHLFIKIKSEYSLEHALSPGKEGCFPRGRGSRLRRNLERHQIMAPSPSKDHVYLPTVSSSGNLASFLWFFFGIFDICARGLLRCFVYNDWGWVMGTSEALSPHDTNMRLQNL